MNTNLLPSAVVLELAKEMDRHEHIGKLVDAFCVGVLWAALFACLFLIPIGVFLCGAKYCGLIP